MASVTDDSPHVPDRNGKLRPLPGLAVAKFLPALQGGYRQDVSWAVADVARLRREAGRQAHESPTAWGLGHLEALGRLRLERADTLRERRAADGVDPAFLSSLGYAAREAQERREDTAVHLAVTLWALHQQSVRDEPMHRAGWAFGRSVRQLALGGAEDRHPGGEKNEEQESGSESAGERPPESGELNETVRKRYVRAAGSTDVTVLAGRMRELVLLLRGSRIPLDYVRLADQLFWWQIPTARDSVTRAWGVELHRRYWGPATEGGQGTHDRPTATGDGSGDGDRDGVGYEEEWGMDA